MKVRVRAVIQKQNQLFLVQHVGHATWCLPGGGIEPGEGLEAALKREIHEELGVKAEIGELMCVHQFRDKGIMQFPEFFFGIKNVSDFNTINIAETSHGQEEIQHAEFRDPQTTDNLRPRFLPELLGTQSVMVKLYD